MNSTFAIEEPEISRIVLEDVLRILGERKERVSLEDIGSEIKVTSSFLSKTIRGLEREDFIHIENEFVGLTRKGRVEARDIVNKHALLENYFEKGRGEIEAHQMAHLLEHYISEEVIDDIKKISSLKGEGVPLTEFEPHKEGIITDIMFSDYALFERLISMGMFPGEKIMITNEIPNGVIIRIENKKYALGNELAKEIKVVIHEKS